MPLCTAFLRGFLIMLVAGVLAVPASADDKEKAALKPGDHERTMEHGGLTRTYRLHVPKDFKDKPVPLVMVIHGLGATGKITETLTGFTPLADKKGFAVVYPDGEKRFWDYLTDKDVKFLTALMNQLTKEGLADEKRIYFTGISNGGYMSNRMGWDLSDKIAAIAPVCGTISKAQAEKAKPGRHLPVLCIHGTEDTIVGYNGKDFITRKEMSLGAEDQVRWWAKKNGCEEKPKVEELPDTAKDGTKVERQTFASKDGADVILYKVIGGGHTWPGGSVQPKVMLGKTSQQFNASEVIWDFFAKHPLPKAPEKKEGD